MSKKNKTENTQDNEDLAVFNISPDEAIIELKKRHPELRNVHFEWYDSGEISYRYDGKRIDIKTLQKEYNELTGQKEYIVTMRAYKRCYALNEKSAMSYANEVTPTGLSAISVVEARD